MLNRVAGDAHRARRLRVVQVALVLGALFLFLGWADGPRTTPTPGRDQLGISLEALVVNPRGAWESGDVLTHEAPGIPLDVAPNATLTLAYASSGVTARDAGWTARLRIAETSGGDAWWSVERDLPIVAQGDRATVAVPLADLVREALGYEEDANVPGQLELSVLVSHAVQVHLQGQDVVAVRSATARFLPSGDVALVTVDPGAGVYPVAATRAWPWPAALALAGAVAIEGVIAAGRRFWSPWHRAVGVHIVAVHGLVPPPGTAQSDLPTLLRAARRSHGQVLLDEESGIAVLTGVVQLVARLAPGDALVVAPATQGSEADGTRPTRKPKKA